MQEQVTLLTKTLKKLRQIIGQILLLPFLLFVDEVSATCDMENYTAIDFSLLTVPNNVKPGEVIETRNATYFFYCDPNSQRALVAKFSNTRPSGNISFYRDTTNMKLFPGVEMRLSVIDQLGKTHVLPSSAQGMDIYYITDSDLKEGFNWSYNVQVELIRTEEALPTERRSVSNNMKIAHFGSSIRSLFLKDAGLLYIKAGFNTLGNSCIVTLPSSITLPMLNIIDLQRSPVTSYLAATDFSINVSCQEDVVASFNFFDVYNKRKGGSVFGLPYLGATPNSSAKGVNFALLSNNRALPIVSNYYDMSASPSINNVIITPANSGLRKYIAKGTSENIPLQVAYYKTNTNVSAGTLGGLVTVAVIYN